MINHTSDFLNYREQTKNQILKGFGMGENLEKAYTEGTYEMVEEINSIIKKYGGEKIDSKKFLDTIGYK